MSVDADRGKRVGEVWLVLTAFAVAAIAVWVFLLPKQQARKPIGPIIAQIDHGDSAAKTVGIRELRGVRLEPGEFAEVLPRLVQATKDEAEMVRFAAAEVIGDCTPLIDPKSCPEVATALAVLLDDPSPMLRARAAQTLGFVAYRGKLDVPPARLVACLDDEDEQVRIAASEAMVEYGQGPELLVAVALRRMPTESPRALGAFTDVFWHVRLEPSVLPALIEGLSSENTVIRYCCAGAINHMGQEARPALAAVLSLLRKEIDTPRPNESHNEQDSIIGIAAGAIGEVATDGECPPGCVEILCEILQLSGGVKQETAHARAASPSPSAPALLSPQEECLAEAVWSLGIIGRPAASAAPLLLSTFESAREASHLRGLTAEALASISQGTPEESRVLASLAQAWKTAPKGQKDAIARALRSFGPKAEQLVPGLRQQPPDKEGSQIRRVRYPRDRHGMPVRG